MTLAERIKEVRKVKNMRQCDFGEKLGVKETTVTSWETGKRNPSEAVILAICKEFSINEDWLRTGQGEMLQPVTRSEIIARFAGELMKEEEDSFRRRLFELLAQLDEQEWETLERLAEKLTKK